MTLQQGGHAVAAAERETQPEFGIEPTAAFGEDGELTLIVLREGLPPEVEVSLAVLLAAR